MNLVPADHHCPAVTAITQFRGLLVYLWYLLTVLARKVINSVVSLCLSVSTPAFELPDFWACFCACHDHSSLVNENQGRRSSVTFGRDGNMFGLSSMAVVRHWARVQRMWFVNSVVAPYLFCGCNVSGFIHWFWRYINRWLAYLTFPVTFFLTYFLYYLSTSLRINPFCFQAGCRKRWLNLTSFFVLSYIVLWVLVLLLLCLIQFFITKPEIGWEERLRNDLFVLDYCKKLNSLKHLVRTNVAESHN